MYIANQSFVHKELVTKVQTEFRSNLKSHFHCGCSKIDFTDKEKSSKIIEDWCEKQTDAGVKNVNLSSGNDLFDLRYNFIIRMYYVKY